MPLVIAVIVLLLAAYAVLISYYLKGWRAISSNKEILSTPPLLHFSVIIPARNEEANIGACLQSIINQHYPVNLFEVIVVDDHSTDNTAAIVKSFSANNVKLLSLAAYVGNNTLNSYKKKAIETAIQNARGNWVITTDADCIATPLWLQSINAYQQQNNAVVIAAPVKIKLVKNVIGIFQTLDFLILQGITGASLQLKLHAMCNGANLAYSKKVFNEVNCFNGIDNIASGDDMLLMHKIITKYPHQYGFLQSHYAVIETLPVLTWRLFFNQRIRWASKATHYKEKKIVLILALVYFLNVALLGCMLAGFFKPLFWLYAIAFIILKTIIEWPFVKTVAYFFQLHFLMRWFLPLQLLHIPYTFIAGFFGQTGTYKWKGRKVQ
jgi:poly-beta-1,6-N-acetyl-D-glucosamine synthase